MSVLRRILKFRGIFTLFMLILTPSVFAQHYVQTNLVSSIPGVGTNPTNPMDTQLVNSWVWHVVRPRFWWVADNGTGVSTLYDGAGTKQQLVVTIPPPQGHPSPSNPTGIVFNGTSDFALPNSTAARFIFVTEDGTIAGWNGGSTAVIVKDNSSKGAVYKGCTIGEVNGKHYLYVANFHSGEIEIYDGTFQPVVLKGKAFVDGDDDDDKTIRV